MAPKRDWVDYVNLGANAAQVYQLHGIQERMGVLAALEVQRTDLERQRSHLEANRIQMERDRENRELAEDEYRDRVFHYDHELRKIKTITDIGLRIFNALVAKFNHSNLKAKMFRSYEDKERLASIQKTNEEIIREGKDQYTGKDVDWFNDCAKYAIERDDLLEVIEVETRLQQLEKEKSVYEVNFAAQKKALEDELVVAEQEMLKNPPSFWLIIAGKKTPFQERAELLKKQLEGFRSDTWQLQREINNMRQSYLYNKFGVQSVDHYREELRDRDLKLKYMLGDYARTIIGDKSYNSFERRETPFGIEWGIDADEEILFQQCIDVIRREKKASVRLLRDQLNLDDETANRFMNELETRGIVGSANEAIPRDESIRIGEKEPQSCAPSLSQPSDAIPAMETPRKSVYDELAMQTGDLLIANRILDCIYAGTERHQRAAIELYRNKAGADLAQAQDIIARLKAEYKRIGKKIYMA